MRGPDGEVIAMDLHKGNLHEINFTKVHEADAANFAQSSKKDGPFELVHCQFEQVNVKGTHALRIIVSAMNLGKNIVPHFHRFMIFNTI